LKYNKNIGLKGNLFRLKHKITNTLTEKFEDYDSSNPYILAELSYKPKITFVILGDGNSAYNSLINQNYINIKVTKFDNFNFDMVNNSDYIGFVNGSDTFYSNYVYNLVEILQEKRYDLVYSDEDTNDGHFYKPDWSPNTLKSMNYIGNTLIVSDIVKPFEDYYEFLLELADKDISTYHISKVLYKTNRKIEVNKRALKHVSGKISIIIPSKDNHESLARCINSIREKSSYDNYEIIIVDNGSSDTNRSRHLADRYVYDRFPFNFSKMCNMGAEKATGDFLLFLNDDTEVITNDWMEVMAAYAQEDNIGAVGAKLYYPESEIIQHCGIINIQPGPVHCFAEFSDDKELYFGRNRYTYDVSAVTAACMMIKRDKFRGFDENFAVAYNDVDLCFSLIDEGYYNVIVNDVTLYHYESLSRGNDSVDPEKLKRLALEKAKLFNKHRNFSGNDRFYNVNLTWHKADFSFEKIDYVIPKMFTEKKYSPIDCKLEYLYIRDNNLYVGGYIKDGGLYKIYIELDNGNKYIAKANKELRTDLSAIYGKNYALSGFSAVIDIRRLKGYGIVKIIAENTFGKSFMCDTGQTVDFE